MTLLDAIKEKIRIDSFRRQNTMPVFDADKLNNRLNELKTMEDKFVWTDELVREFALGCKVNGASDWVHTQIEQFKASKLPSKEYEILCYGVGGVNYTPQDPSSPRLPKACNPDIITVKRLSDGEVFSVGDGLANMLGGSSIIDGFQCDYSGNQLWINTNKKYNYGCSLSVAEKAAKKPLFITDDGITIFDRMEVFKVNPDLKMFHFLAGTDSQNNPENFPDSKWFSTYEAANEYILLNKPCLSLNDLLSVWDEQADIEHYRNSPLFKNFKELVKSKINQK